MQYSGVQADGGSDDWPVSVELSNGKRIEANFVISAVGVVPNTEWLGGTLELHPEDLGILVDRCELVKLRMRASNLPNSSQQRAHNYSTRHIFQTFVLYYFHYLVQVIYLVCGSHLKFQAVTKETCMGGHNWPNT